MLTQQVGGLGSPYFASAPRKERGPLRAGIRCVLLGAVSPVLSNSVWNE